MMFCSLGILCGCVPGDFLIAMSGFFRGSKRIEKKEEGYWRKLLRLQDGQIGKVRTVNRDLYIVFGKFFRSFQFDLYFLILLLLDGDRLFQAIVMQAQTLNGDIILSGGDLRDRDAVVIISSIDLINDACTGVVETIEDDQHGILMILCGEVAEFEANGACIDHLSGFGGVAGCGSRQGTFTSSTDCYREEQTSEVSS